MGLARPVGGEPMRRVQVNACFLPQVCSNPLIISQGLLSCQSGAPTSHPFFLTELEFFPTLAPSSTPSAPHDSARSTGLAGRSWKKLESKLSVITDGPFRRTTRALSEEYTECQCCATGLTEGPQCSCDNSMKWLQLLTLSEEGE